MLEIKTYGEAVLRRKGGDVASVDAPLLQWVDDLIAAMHGHNGLGLAAQQVGRTERVCVIDVPPGVDDEGLAASGQPAMPLVLINPHILERGGGEEEREEGCLSFPGLYAPVTRPARVQAEYLDRQGQKQVLTARGLLARAVQHEVDHLDGVLFIDHLSAARRLSLSHALRKLKKQTGKREPVSCR